MPSIHPAAAGVTTPHHAYRLRHRESASALLDIGRVIWSVSISFRNMGNVVSLDTLEPTFTALGQVLLVCGWIADMDYVNLIQLKSPPLSRLQCRLDMEDSGHQLQVRLRILPQRRPISALQNPNFPATTVLTQCLSLSSFLPSSGAHSSSSVGLTVRPMPAERSGQDHNVGPAP